MLSVSEIIRAAAVLDDAVNKLNFLFAVTHHTPGTLHHLDRVSKIDDKLQVRTVLSPAQHYDFENTTAQHAALSVHSSKSISAHMLDRPMPLGLREATECTTPHFEEHMEASGCVSKVQLEHGGLVSSLRLAIQEVRALLARSHNAAAAQCWDVLQPLF